MAYDGGHIVVGKLDKREGGNCVHLMPDFGEMMGKYPLTREKTMIEYF